MSTFNIKDQSRRTFVIAGLAGLLGIILLVAACTSFGETVIMYESDCTIRNFTLYERRVLTGPKFDDQWMILLSVDIAAKNQIGRAGITTPREEWTSLNKTLEDLNTYSISSVHSCLYSSATVSYDSVVSGETGWYYAEMVYVGADISSLRAQFLGLFIPGVLLMLISLSICTYATVYSSWRQEYEMV